MMHLFHIGAVLFAAAAAGAVTYHYQHISETRPPEQVQQTKLEAAELEPLKADFAAVMPKPVQTVKFARPPTPPTSVAEVELPEHNGYVNRHDVCAKHGGHRVDSRRGRHLTWRCVYPGK